MQFCDRTSNLRSVGCCPFFFFSAGGAQQQKIDQKTDLRRVVAFGEGVGDVSRRLTRRLISLFATLSASSSPVANAMDGDRTSLLSSSGDEKRRTCLITLLRSWPTRDQGKLVSLRLLRRCTRSLTMKTGSPVMAAIRIFENSPSLILARL